jgi:hypothetical protein
MPVGIAYPMLPSGRAVVQPGRKRRNWPARLLDAGAQSAILKAVQVYACVRDMLSSAKKVAINTLCARDLCPLSHAEYIEVLKRTDIATLWLPTAALRGRASPKDGKQARPAGTLHAIARAIWGDGNGICEFNEFNLVRFARLKRRPLTAVTFKFIHEIISEQRSYDQTTLFQRMKTGTFFVRQVQGQKILIDDDLKFKRYFDACVALIESIATYGLRASDTEGSYISVAIDDHGQFLHATKGMHRLGIALELGIPRVPVTIRHISGPYFRRFFDWRCAVSDAYLFGALRACVADAALRACAPTIVETPAGHVARQLEPASAAAG